MWKLQRLSSVLSFGIRAPSLQERIIRIGTSMQILRTPSFRIPPDDSIYTELTIQKMRQASCKWTSVLVPCHSSCRLIPTEDYLVPTRYKRSKDRSSGQWYFVLSWILVSMTDFRMQLAKYIIFFLWWSAPQRMLRTHRSLEAYCATL
jgi:hypothetical protein